MSARVGWLNPAWNEPFDGESVDVSKSIGVSTPQDTKYNVLQNRFTQASKLTGEEFLGRLDYYYKAWIPARDIVAAGLKERLSVDPSARIILFESFAPWKEHLFELEA